MSDRHSDAWNTDKITSSNERIAIDAMVARFYMFFSGLIFATVSFIGTNTIKTSIVYLKVLEIVSLGCLLVSGILLLVRLSGARFIVGNEKHGSCLERLQLCFLDIVFNRDKYYWGLFIIGMVLMIFNRSVLLFYP